MAFRPETPLDGPGDTSPARPPARKEDVRRPSVSIALAILALSTPLGAGAPETATAERRVDPFIVAAGDIACQPPWTTPATSRKEVSCHEDATAAMFATGGRLSGPELRGILPLGDLQYISGRLDEFTYADDDCSIVPPHGTAPCSFDASWGSAASRPAPELPDVPFYPTPGNHEYEIGSATCRLAKLTGSAEPYNACGYNDYFGNRVAAPRASRNGDGRGSYVFRFDTEGPHPILFVSLNVGQCERNHSKCDETSRTVSFLRRTLASPEANPAEGCAVVYYHQPAWDAYDHGDIDYIRPIWQTMLGAELGRARRPDLVLNGHNHLYERYEPLDVDGRTATGRAAIPQITVGTGGRDVAHLPPTPPETAASPPAAVDVSHFGLLKVSWSPEHGRITTSYHREGDPVPFDPVTYHCRGAGRSAGDVG